MMFAILPLLMLLGAAPKPPSPRTITFGVGNNLCADAVHPENVKRALDYSWGFWSGMNVASNKNVGHTADEHGIGKDVMLVCLAQPKLPLLLATLVVHMRYEKENR